MDLGACAAGDDDEEVAGLVAGLDILWLWGLSDSCLERSALGGTF